MRGQRSVNAVRKVAFITGTRADFGKLRPLMDRVAQQYELHVFVTGMHMLSKYGSTHTEVDKRGYPNIYRFINQNHSDSMDAVLGKTIQGLSDYVKEVQPDLIIVHGDRVEALAGATVGALNNILVAHIEGGEVSGTIDESIRHAISKFAHLHFVANEHAWRRLIQLGEDRRRIHIIGSPDVDVILSDDLPDLDAVKTWYEIGFQDYGILLFHPVTTEPIADQARQLVDQVINSGKNYVVIYPNNDLGSDHILREYERLKGPRFRVIPSMRFECFLTLLKHAEFILGNSSCALMEAPYYGVPGINVGSRQSGRASLPSVINCDVQDVGKAISKVRRFKPVQHFGIGNSADNFMRILPTIWDCKGQKVFCEIDSAA